MFYDQFVKLCKARGVSPSAVMVSIGLNKSNATFWKKGSIPKGETLQKLADYFGVSIDYLLGLADAPDGVAFGDGTGYGGGTGSGAGIGDGTGYGGPINAEPTQRALIDMINKMSESEMRVTLAMIKQMIAERPETAPEGE